MTPQTKYCRIHAPLHPTRHWVGFLMVLALVSLAYHLPDIGPSFSTIPSPGRLSVPPRPGRQAGQDSSGRALIFPLDSGYFVRISDDTVTLLDPGHTPLARNTTILRRPDAGPCPSAGFLDVTTKGAYFTIEQQTCSGWLIVNEYITFRLSRKERQAWLHRFGLRFIDRWKPDLQIPDRGLSARDFGRVPLDAVRLDQLYSRLPGSHPDKNK